MARGITTTQKVFSNRCIGISKTLVNLDSVHDKNRMVKVIIDGKEYWLRHAADQTNRLSGITEIDRLFKDVKQFSYFYNANKNAIVVTLTGKYPDTEFKLKEYYNLFPDDLRERGERLSKYYIILFCLENFIRHIISSTLNQIHGSNWWAKCINDEIKRNVTNNKSREEDAAVTLRSDKNIDYTTFGELIIIVNENWKDFESIFTNQKAFKKVMYRFNTLRGPIAHCCSLAEDEEKRFDLCIRDWFKRCLKT
jgi:hypothetical protein